MKVAVTGGSGQLGTLVLQRLLSDARVTQVVSLDVRPLRVAETRLQAVTADVRDADIGCHLAGVDALIHLAFLVTQLRPRAEFEDINIAGSRNLFQAAAAAGVRQVLYASSIAAYGVVPGQPVPITEDTPRRYQPEFPYAACKYEVEAFLDSFEAAHPHIAVARLRPAVLIGARMEHLLGDALRRRLLLATLDHVPPPLVLDEDVADAFLLALHREARGAFNLMADEPLPPAELARATGSRLVRIAPRTLLGLLPLANRLARWGFTGLQTVDPAWIRSAGAMMIMSSERARAVLGWQPRCATHAAVLQHYYQALADGGPEPGIGQAPRRACYDSAGKT